jgi:hypothetical protein
MNQINVVAAGIFGAIAVSVAYMVDFYPVWVAVGSLGLIGYTAFAPSMTTKKKPPAEPWYMK